MFRKFLLITISFLLFNFHFLRAQPAERKLSRKEYIQQYKDEAIREMNASGVPASITLAQALLESDNGNSPLATYANNHFGIKCQKGWEGPTFIQDDDTKNECFRKYYSVYESYRDHSVFLKNRQRYSLLFELNYLDYKGWAYGLKQAGYATNPKYAELLIKIIEDNGLHEFDTAKPMPPLAEKKEKEIAKPVSLNFTSNAGLSISIHENEVKYVIARKGDSYFKIANELNMRLWQIYKYNDFQKGRTPQAGEVIYLQPKRNRAKDDFHIVKEGETMHSVSQLYCIKLKKLYRKNNMISGSEPEAEQKLSLRKNIRGK